MLLKNKELHAFPIVDELKYRQKIDTTQLNKILTSLEESALRSILRGRELTSLLSKLNLAVTTSYLSLDRKPNQIVQPIYNSSRKIAFATPFSSVFKLNNTEPLTTDIKTDKIFGNITLGWDKIRSKVPLLKSATSFVPDIVSPLVKVLFDGIERDKEDNIYDCLDQLNDSFWIETTTAGTHTIEIQLPGSVHKLMNYIKLVPIPMYGFDITKIEYQDNRSVWNEINISHPSFSLPRAEPIKLYLAPKDFNGSLKITTNVYSDILAIGFSNIDIGLIDFQNTPQTAFVKFDADFGTNPITIRNLKLDYYIDDPTKYNQSPITDISITNTTDGSGEEVKISNSYDVLSLPQLSSASTNLGVISTPNHNLYLKMTLNEFTSATPVFKGARLEYN